LHSAFKHHGAITEEVAVHSRMPISFLMCFSTAFFNASCSNQALASLLAMTGSCQEVLLAN
jgi:hypothetical protein